MPAYMVPGHRVRKDSFQEKRQKLVTELLALCVRSFEDANYN